jgi:16S rRNA processing protein RimM
LTEPEHWLRAGVVGRPHGLDGSFHVLDPVPGLLELDAGVRVAGEVRRVTRLAGHARGVILRVQGCDDRNLAAGLGGQELFVSRDRAPDLDEDEWWAEDLVGCAVRDGDREVGVVVRLLALPSCEVLEVSREPGTPALLVPLVRDAVRDVDLDGRVIDVDLEFLGEA